MNISSTLKKLCLMAITIPLSCANLSASEEIDPKGKEPETRVYYQKMTLAEKLECRELENGRKSYTYTVEIDEKTGLEKPAHQEILRELKRADLASRPGFETKPWNLRDQYTFDHTLSFVVKTPQLPATAEYMQELMTLAFMKRIDLSNPQLEMQASLKGFFPEIQGMLFPEETKEKLLPVHVFITSAEATRKNPWQILVTGTDGMRWSELSIVKSLNEAGFSVAVIDFANMVESVAANCSGKHATLADQLSKQSFFGNAMALHVAIEYLRFLPGFDHSNFNLTSFSLGSVITMLAFDPAITQRVSHLNYPKKMDIVDPLVVIASPEMDARFKNVPVTVWTAREDQMFGDQETVIKKLLNGSGSNNWNFKKIHSYHDGLQSTPEDYVRYWTRNPKTTDYRGLCHQLPCGINDLTTRLKAMAFEEQDENRMNKLMQFISEDLKVQRLSSDDQITLLELMTSLKGLKPKTITVGIDRHSFSAHVEYLDGLKNGLRELLPQDENESAAVPSAEGSSILIEDISSGDPAPETPAPAVQEQ